MAVPKYDEMYNDFLMILSDEKEHDIKEIREEVAKIKKLTETDLKETLNSGKCKYFNRIGWTATYLKKAGLINSNRRGAFNITSEGKRIVNDKKEISNEFLLIYDSFKKFKYKDNENITLKTKKISKEENDIFLRS